MTSHRLPQSKATEKRYRKVKLLRRCTKYWRGRHINSPAKNKEVLGNYLEETNYNGIIKEDCREEHNLS